MSCPRPADPRLRTCRRLSAVVALGLAAVGMGWFLSCGDDQEFPFDDATCETALKGEDAVAADEWLKDPYGGEKRIGGWSTDLGLAFYHELEARGAVRIVAVGVSKRPGREPSEEAIGLVVQLPDDPAKRRALFELHARQVRGAGYKPRADRGQKYLLFGWKPGPLEKTSSGPDGNGRVGRTDER